MATLSRILVIALACMAEGCMLDRSPSPVAGERDAESTVDGGHLRDGGPDAEPIRDAGVDSCRPLPEVCDGVDQDCDTTVDEGLEDQTCGVGVCERTAPSCVAGVAPACTPAPVSTLFDLCANGLDEDCDGMVDESGCARRLFHYQGDIAPNNSGWTEACQPTGDCPAGATTVEDGRAVIADTDPTRSVWYQKAWDLPAGATNAAEFTVRADTATAPYAAFVAVSNATARHLVSVFPGHLEIGTDCGTPLRIDIDPVSDVRVGVEIDAATARTFVNGAPVDARVPCAAAGGGMRLTVAFGTGDRSALARLVVDEVLAVQFP